MTSPVFTPLQMFYSTSGLPLTDGYIYIGTASQNPQTNPIAVYWDAAGTIPAAQPIRTSGGYPVRNGSPATVFVLATDFSLIVRDKSSKLVFSRLSGNAFSAEWVTYTPAGTGAVVTTVQAKLRSLAKRPSEFGAVGDGVTDDSSAFIKLAAVTGVVDLEGKTYLISPTAKIQMLCVAMFGAGATIKLGASMNVTTLEFPNAQTIDEVTFDGNGFYCCDNNYDHFIVSVTSPRVIVENCVFKNLVGLQDRWQYGLGIRWNTRSITRNCTFSDIHTPTNTANSAGFCGGIFIASDPANTSDVQLSNHLVENCNFQNIWTTANAAAQVYHDSDGVRSFIYGAPGAPQLENLYNSTLTVRGCSFVNVLKSATKLSYAQTYVSDCRFRVTDALTQVLVYAAFRYQAGVFFSVKNVSVNGEKIVLAVLAGGAINFVENVYFASTYSTPSAVRVGNTDLVTECNISDVYVDSAANIVQLGLATTVNLTRCTSAVAHTSFLELVDDVTNVTFQNCSLKSKTSLYSVSKTITNLSIQDCTLSNTLTGTIFGGFPITNLVLNGVTHSSTNGAVVSTNVTNLSVVNSAFSTAGTIATRAFNLDGATSFSWTDSKLTDTSNKDIGIYSVAASNRIDGLTSNVTCTNAQVLLAPTGGTSTNTLRNATFTGGQAHLIEVQKCNKMQMANINSEVTSGDIEFWSSVANTAALANFTGLLAATPVIKTNYTVTETGTVAL